jgi:hypothetical protein
MSLTWLAKEAKRLVENIPPGEQELFRQQIARTEEFLRERTPHEKGLMILAGPTTWELVPFQLPIENELHWGRPALTQLLWFLSENKPYCIVALDRKRARFLKYWLGEMAELAEHQFDIDISQWKKEELGHVSGLGVQKTYGSQRDTYEHRMDAQYRRLCRETAAQAKRLCEAGKLRAVFLVGSDRLTKPIAAEFSEEFRQHIVLINEDFGWLSLPELQTRLTSKIADYEREHESALVTALLGNERTAVIGIDETLAQLQKIKMRTLVLARHLTGSLRQCIECGWTDRSADPVCSVCGRERREVELRDILPDLARSTNAEVEVVSGEAAEKLSQSGGMGGWFRGRTQAQLR